MIKALGRNGDGEPASLFLGLSRENTKRLHDNKPIMFRLRDVQPDLPDISVVIMAGESNDELMEDLRSMAPIRSDDAE